MDMRTYHQFLTEISVLFPLHLEPGLVRTATHHFLKVAAMIGLEGNPRLIWGPTQSSSITKFAGNVGEIHLCVTIGTCNNRR